MRTLGDSGALREDLAAVRAARARPPLDPARAAERFVELVTQYNAFVNHAPRPFRPVADADMRL
jgi:hypothetical protein